MAARSEGAGLTRVFSYVVRKDSGFSPNPFHGHCTLACCKPRIRHTARPGDLIVGLSRRCESVVYVLRVEERLGFDAYWNDRRFRRKRAQWDSARARDRLGDNIYEPDAEGGFVQHPSGHWDHACQREDGRKKRTDLGGEAVLVGREFVYFGRAGLPLPAEVGFLRVQRAHRCRFTPEQVAAVQRWFASLGRGLLGRPHVWSDDDETWQPGCA